MNKTKTSIIDLNEMLFMQLETLSNPDLEGEELKVELNRAKAINNTAKNIIDIAGVVLEAQKFAAEEGIMNEEAKKLLMNDPEKMEKIK